MIDRERVLQVILEAVDEVNVLLPEERQVGRTADSMLFGAEGGLDSISLVNLIVTVEQGIEEQFDATLVLADEKAMSRRTSPFRTVATLQEYIANLLEEIPHE